MTVNTSSLVSSIVYETFHSEMNRVRAHLENSWIFGPWKSLKFCFIRFGPGQILNFNWGTFTILRRTLGNTGLSQQHKIGVEEMKVRYWLTNKFWYKWLPLRTKAHYYPNIFIVYLESVLKVINYVFEILNCSPWKSLKSPWILYGNKCTNPEFII